MLLQAKNTYFVVKIKKRKKGITLYNYLFLKFKQLPNVKVELKPTFMISNLPVTSPVYIPVNFAFGG